MISPIELGLMIQTTIYFTIVSDPDSFQWSCSSSEFLSEACYPATFDANFPSLQYYYCHQSTIDPILIPYLTQPDCGTTQADVVLSVAVSGVCSGGCYHFSVPDESDTFCACGNVTTAVTPSQFVNLLNDRDICAQNFLYLMIGLLIILVAWLLRIMLQGTWTYFRFYAESIATKRKTGTVTEDSLSEVYGTVTSHWNYRGKYFFFGVDVLCGVGLLIIMILIATTPFSFCSQTKLYTSIALAALAFSNIISVIPYIVVWRFIEQRILMPLSAGIKFQTAGENPHTE
eukprot:CAMPEP_0168541114 /NCGR_PEP_ID=MMETSP0413-20121227/643_1 /TAXON_ID=136452 /ORGANISM="Filamoeba nolandi, Strain NC-AS-23-1" /LENGTH=286 /DNA_ID=CAMNT_0008570905 /DNA_START=82 /DNA_END=945 /DNA_ORIENTATION=+